MVVEIALLQAKAGMAAQLGEGLRAARPVIARAAGYRDSVFYRGLEEPDSFILRVEWDTLEAHMRGFRESPLLAEWRSHPPFALQRRADGGGPGFAAGTGGDLGVDVRFEVGVGAAGAAAHAIGAQRRGQGRR